MVDEETARRELGLLAASPEEVCEALRREALGLLSREEAEGIIGEIGAHVGRTRALLYRFHQGQGWKALGYPSWKACYESRFGLEQTHIFRELKAAEIEQALAEDSPMGEWGVIPERHLRPLARFKTPDEWRALWSRAHEAANGSGITGALVQRVVEEWLEQARQEELVLVGDQVRNKPRGTARLNRTNQKVSWAWWTWNPVTGCLHDCPYCYARDIANRFYAQGFAPTFLADRLDAPHNTPLPEDPDPRSRRVFACSMADLFGKWVPQEWIDAVFKVVREESQWTYLFLTKFPQRLAELNWPDNAWVGTTVDRQYRVAIAEKAFRGVKAGIKWLSCEPMLEPLKFTSLEMFDWVVIGGASRSSQTPESFPDFEWLVDVYNQARAAGCKVYFKENTWTAAMRAPMEEP
jgi:protein gp37